MMISVVERLIKLAAGRKATVWRAYGPMNAWGQQEATHHLSFDDKPPPGLVSHKWYSQLRDAPKVTTEPPLFCGVIHEDGTYKEDADG
jgi:hypothetical protein